MGAHIFIILYFVALLHIGLHQFTCVFAAGSIPVRMISMGSHSLERCGRELSQYFCLASETVSLSLSLSLSPPSFPLFAKS